ncbi:Nif3-like dinuclear metal center hexameric protein [Mycoplasmatota bacterium]|nr:Nif3-like dinuclear metal center hexameric protein [Mycoplasmatota bacterium]
MNTKTFETTALSFFPKETLAFFDDGTQYGFNQFRNKEIKKIGYSVNVTKDIIKQAINQKVDLLLTHHNIWEDHYELRDDCLKLLEENNLIHFFNHLPLDSMPFGPTGVLANDLDLKVIEKISQFETFYFGVVGEVEKPLTLQELTHKVEKIMNHKVRVWQNNDRLIKRIGIVAGSGSDLESLHDAVHYQCDAFITGEKKLKTLLYAKHNELNFILGSHTFSELGGIRVYAHLIKDKMGDIELVELQDEWIE